MKQPIRVSLTALTLAMGLVLTVPAFASAQTADDTSVSSTTAENPTTTGSAAPTPADGATSRRVDQMMQQRRKDMEAQRDALRDRARQIVKTAQETRDGKLVSEVAVPTKEDLEALRQKAEDSLPKQAEQRAELKVEGQKLLAQLKADKPEQAKRPAEDKVKSCEARKAAMTKRFENLVSRNKAMQQRLDGAMTKAVAYQQEKQLTSADLAAAMAAATAAKAKAAASVTALSAAVPVVNCDDPDAMAQAVATLKVAANKSRDDLHAYLKSLKDVMKQLLTARQVTKAAEAKTEETTAGTATEGSN